MFFIASKSHNDIDRGKRESNILIIIAIGLAGFVAMMLVQGIINGLLQYLAKIFEFQASSKNTSNVVQIIKLNPTPIQKPCRFNLPFKLKRRLYQIIINYPNATSKIIITTKPSIKLNVTVSVLLRLICDFRLL